MQQGPVGSHFLPAPDSAAPISLQLPLSGNGFDELGLHEAEEHRFVAGSCGSPGNRWPRQETMQLLKIRTDMDAAFRDATLLKAPLWEDVSRKLREMGFHRSAKKCKEKFENVYKYYKRTKEARASRQDGKSYRFFTQLEALILSSSPSPAPSPSGLPPTVPCSAPMITLEAAKANVMPPLHAAATQVTVAPPIFDPACGLISSSSNTSSFSDTESEGHGIASRKRKQEAGGGGEDEQQGNRKIVMEFFDGLIQQVMERQEAMLQRFLEAIERREQDRMIREEAWRRQEKSRITREHELAAQERAAAASRDDAIIYFLQKLTGQTIPIPPWEAPQTNIPAAEPPISPTAPPQSTQALHPLPQLIQQPSSGAMEPAASSRWQKSEVYALITLRCSMEARYQESGPKGPLWEEISAGMSRQSYNRSSKRCKEKWENINKYFKKVKENNKSRPEDAKTCPYFHQLDALYRSKLLVGTTSGTDHLAITPPPQEQKFDYSSAAPERNR